MKMSWEYELELLKKAQKEDEYGLAICDALQKTMNLIMEQGHSGFSMNIFSNILNKLLNNKPLFPLTDSEDEWQTDIYGDYKSIQNKRYSALFKNEDGTYSDVDRVVFIDTYDNKNTAWQGGGVTKLIDDMFPITLPYMPSDKPYYVYGKDMYLDPDGTDKTKERIGTSNYTVAYYIITPDGKKIDLNNKVLYDSHTEISE